MFVDELDWDCKLFWALKQNRKALDKYTAVIGPDTPAGDHFVMGVWLSICLSLTKQFCTRLVYFSLSYAAH